MMPRLYSLGLQVDWPYASVVGLTNTLFHMSSGKPSVPGPIEARLCLTKPGAKKLKTIHRKFSSACLLTVWTGARAAAEQPNQAACHF